MTNQVIEAIDKDHGKKVIEYWHSQGVNVNGFGVICTLKDGGIFRYYGVIDGRFGYYSIRIAVVNNAEIIELPKEEKNFPRVMLVSDDAVVWNKAVVVCLRGGYAFATIEHSSVDEYENALKNGDSVPFYSWKHHKELSDGNKVSKALIAEMFGIELEHLEIVE